MSFIFGNTESRRTYRTSDGDYQYEIYFWNGMLYQPQETYQKARQAKTVGIESIKTVIGY